MNTTLDSGPAQLGTDSLHITNTAHEDFRTMRWVPAHTVPSPIQALLAVVGVVAGAALGVGLAPWLTVRVPPRTIELVAKSCAADRAACEGLAFELEPKGFSGWLWIGCILLVVYAMATVWQARPDRPRKT